MCWGGSLIVAALPIYLTIERRGSFCAQMAVVTSTSFWAHQVCACSALQPPGLPLFDSACSCAMQDNASANSWWVRRLIPLHVSAVALFRSLGGELAVGKHLLALAFSAATWGVAPCCQPHSRPWFMRCKNCLYSVYLYIGLWVRLVSNSMYGF